MYDDCRCTVRGRIRRGGLALILATSFAPVGARAEDTANGGTARRESRADVVFEVQEATCPRVPNEYIRAVFNRLKESGRAVAPSMVKNVAEGRIPLPSQTDPAMTAAKIRAKFKEAKRKAIGKGWNFDEAIKLYEEGFRWAAENQAVVVNELDAPTWMTEAFVGYATTLVQANRVDDAKAAYKKQMISFPDLPVTSNRHGPDAAQLYESVRKDVDAEPRGTLLVTVNRPDANIFINYVGRGRGGNFQANVVEGTYEVLVEVGDKSLRYVVPTDPSKTKHAELRIDWDLDSRLVVGDSSVCVEHVANQREIVAGLQRKLPGRNLVLASRTTSDGIRWLRVEKYEPADTVPSRPCIMPEGDNVGRKLADCIDGQNVPGVLASIPVRLDATTRESAGSPSQFRHWLGFGIAAGSVGAGIYFASIDGTCMREDASLPGGCAEERDARLETGISLGVGAVSLAYAIYAYNRYGNAVRSYRPTVGVSAARGGGFVTIAGGF